ncbi:MAG TPA: MotA/TolQ/ExbB proton channel family protein [Candidatus Polarisedimenticolia bacterium]|nr:MotA/TolQ/ExbB proton channel family protein [Candidatus Polarisedimenticolia bacterium]
MMPEPFLLLAAVGQGFHGDVLRLVADSGPVVKLILLLLLGFSVLSWAVMIERYRALKKAEDDSIAFLNDLQRERRLTDLRDRASRYAASPLVPIFLAGFRELTSALADGVGRYRGGQGIPEEARGRIQERVRRRLEESGLAEADRLDRNLGVLATTGSVTPFVGLFGTVWGIMSAFQGIGVTGSASLGAVAPGISEALVATAAGLGAAIPAVIGYNLLLTRARRLGARIERFVMSFGALADLHVDASGHPAAPVEAGKAQM